MTTPNAPSWTVPSASGQLSNNTTPQVLNVKYSNPATSDLVGQLRVRGIRTRHLGARDSTVSWDSGWVGNPTIAASPVALTSWPVAIAYKGRVYVLNSAVGGPGSIALWSAATNGGGGSLGSWRFEGNLPVPPDPNAVFIDRPLAIANGRLVVVFVNTGTGSWCYTAPIAGDGSIGAWLRTNAPATKQNPGAYSCGIIGTGTTTFITNPAPDSYVIAIMGNGGTSLQASVGTVAADGTITWVVSAATIAGTINGCGALFWDGAGYIWIIGGRNNATTQTTVQSSGFNFSTGAISNFGTGSALPAAIGSPGLAWMPPNPQTLNAGGMLYVFTPGSTTVRRAAITLAGSISGAWSTTTAALPNAAGGAIPPAFVSQDMTGRVFALDGTTNQFAVSNQLALGGADVTSWASGTGAAFSVAGVTVTTNAASQSLVFNYGGFGTAIATALVNTDVVTLSVQTTDNTGGDLSPLAYTTIAIGAVPTIGSIVPANASAPSTDAPAISFTYTPGSGGGPQFSYRIQLKQSTTTLFDTGLKYDSVNALTTAQVQALLKTAQSGTVGGLLKSGTVYTLLIDVTSSDTAMSGSSNAATQSSTTFTPSLAAASATPT